MLYLASLELYSVDESSDSKSIVCDVRFDFMHAYVYCVIKYAHIPTGKIFFVTFGESNPRPVDHDGRAKNDLRTINSRPLSSTKQRLQPPTAMLEAHRQAQKKEGSFRNPIANC